MLQIATSTTCNTHYCYHKSFTSNYKEDRGREEQGTLTLVIINDIMQFA